MRRAVRVAIAAGAAALGALAVGAIAVGSVAIGRLAVKSGRVRRLRVDELSVGRLRIETREHSAREHGTMQAPEGWHSVTPRIVVAEPAQLVDFMQRVFDASGEFATEMPSLMRIGDSIVMVSGAGPREPAPAFLHVYVEDVDATYRRAIEAGAECMEEPEEMPYGDRRAMVKDPFGNDWQIATRK